MVGTKLGFYEGAVAARGDCKGDPNGMIFGISGEEEEARASYGLDWGGNIPNIGTQG